MKITKKELFSIIDSIDKLLEDIDCNDRNLAKKVYDLRYALYEDELEIEGYERVPAWIKFDPDDPKTIPPKNTLVFLTEQGVPLDDSICTWRTHKYKKENARGLPGTFTHWRLVPAPPVEKEMSENDSE